MRRSTKLIWSIAAAAFTVYVFASYVEKGARAT